MRAMITCTAVAVTLALVGWFALAQELVPAPDPVGGVKVDAGPSAQVVIPPQPAPTGDTTAARGKDAWRYRWFNGRWWYWTPQKHWMWYSDDSRWVEFDPSHTPPAVVSSEDYPPGYGGYSYYPPRGYYYPYPGYRTGYYPGVAVGVRPYGNVDVGVGRRIGVDVWGPHGGVRVGRIQVGW